jgi:protein Tex
MLQSFQVEYISKTLEISALQTNAVLGLLVESATVPFIARYRKEQTQNLDEVQILDIKKLYEKFLEANKRRTGIIESITEQGKMTTELRKQIDQALFTSDLEEIYLPYKPKRKTRALEAIARGLEPLAKLVFEQRERNLEQHAQKFLNKDVKNTAEALQGARDIIAEWVADDLQARGRIRNIFVRYGIMTAKLKKGKETEAQKFKDYFDYSGSVKELPSHRYLAIKRGEEEGFLKVSIEIDEEKALDSLEIQFLKGLPEAKDQVRLALQDSLKRLMLPSLENEADADLKEKADAVAIKIFADNLRQLLLASPLGQKRVLAIDPGFRTGCKMVVLDEKGDLLADSVIYLHKEQEAQAQIRLWVEKYDVKALAVGNGTASRETEELAQKALKQIPTPTQIKVHMVSEQGASIYSASEVAREEFPHKDITVRGSVSIGRRLMDPLAELVKIDPKSIGVGQYQHDVNQKALKESLDDVVVSCVNQVGVELNTASKSLLAYVSGIGEGLAQNIVEYRKANGQFKSREDLKSVPRLGGKAYEQAAGFLRIKDASNILDNTAVHPERYKLVSSMAKDAGLKLSDFVAQKEVRKNLDLKKYMSAEVGMLTLKDIMDELDKPGRDPREELTAFSFGNVNKPEDLRTGMVLPGIVTNITAFGCFVDIGVHQDGLVHLSQLAHRFVKDPNEVVKVHQKVQVKVTEVDLGRKRIALSMKL